MTCTRRLDVTQRRSDPEPPGRAWTPGLLLAAAVLLVAPSGLLRVGVLAAGPEMRAALFGLGIVGGAFVLAWATEVAQVDISAGLAVAILAVVAVLPEYAVDLVFAWKAASDAAYNDYVMANMTGANRLLVGVGWPLVVFLFALKYRERRIEVGPHQTPAIAALGAATMYAFLLPVKGDLAWWDAIPLVGGFAVYLWIVSRQGMEEPPLAGPSALLARLSQTPRRLVTGLLFLFASGAIVLAAEPFAEALIESGETLGISKYLLVQWVAPLASESPELLIVCFWTLRGMAEDGLQALISSKVNQWMLLVGTIPLVYSLALGDLGSLELNEFQEEEILLTSAQSLLAVFMLSSLYLGVVECVILFVLFVVQFLNPDWRMETTYAYLALCGVFLVMRWRLLGRLSRWTFRSPP